MKLKFREKRNANTPTCREEKLSTVEYAWLPFKKIQAFISPLHHSYPIGMPPRFYKWCRYRGK